MSRPFARAATAHFCRAAALWIIIWRRLSLAALAAAALVAPASAQGSTMLGGVSLGVPVQSVVKALGTPGLVATTDDGHEWRWFDAQGLDVDLLTDNALVVRQVLVAQPEPIHGLPAKLMQPHEFPLLEQSASYAAAFMKSAGAHRQPEPEGTISAWRAGNDLIVLELSENKVNKIMALDALSAAHLGYIPGPRKEPYHAARLVRQYPVDYPRRAIERHAEGVVVVEVRLTATGSVEDVAVLVSSGDPDIDRAESSSMRRSTFSPALCNGASCPSVYLDREEYTLAP